MRIVIDTNILVSAVLRDRDPEFIIQFIVDHPEFEWIVSPEILTEYKAVLSRPKFRLTSEVRDRWFALLDTFPVCIAVDVTVDFPDDPDDAKFLACAVAANADFLITGDAALSQVQNLGKIAIVAVATFKQLFCDVG